MPDKERKLRTATGLAVVSDGAVKISHALRLVSYESKEVSSNTTYQLVCQKAKEMREEALTTPLLASISLKQLPLASSISAESSSAIGHSRVNATLTKSNHLTAVFCKVASSPSSLLKQMAISKKHELEVQVADSNKKPAAKNSQCTSKEKEKDYCIRVKIGRKKLWQPKQQCKKLLSIRIYC